MRLILTCICALTFAGCAQQKTLQNAREHQTDWFVQKATAWFENQRAAFVTGKLAGVSAAIDGRDFDRGLPVKTERAGDMVIVSLPRVVTDRRQEWFSIYLDARTGEVKDSGPREVVY